MANLLNELNGKRKALLLIAAACVLGAGLLVGAMWALRGPVIVVVEPQDAAPAYSQIDMADYWPLYAITVPHTTTLACYRLEFGQFYTSEGTYVGQTFMRATGSHDLCATGDLAGTQWFRYDFDKEQTGGYQEGCSVDYHGGCRQDHAVYVSAWDSDYSGWSDYNPIIWSAGWHAGLYTATLDTNIPLEEISTGSGEARVWSVPGVTTDPPQVWIPRYIKSTYDTSCTECGVADFSTGTQWWYYDWHSPFEWGSAYCDDRSYQSHEAHDSFRLFNVGEMTIGGNTGDVVLWYFDESLDDAEGFSFSEMWYLMEDVGLVRIDQLAANRNNPSYHNPRTMCIISGTVDYGS